jgi:septal ring factor EnvC (AmiA/AmiB activator)
MSSEQIAALLGTIVGAPILIELVKKWFEARTLRHQGEQSRDLTRDQREWQALETALARERKVYQDILEFERAQFAERLASVEAQIRQIREESQACQRAYWEERVQRELLLSRVQSLETELGRTHEPVAS